MDAKKQYHSIRKKSGKYKTARSEARKKRYALYDEKANVKEGYNNDNVIAELYIPPKRTRNRLPIPHVEDHCYQSNQVQVVRK